MVELICEQCLKSYKTKPYMATKSIHHFCSMKCYGYWQRKNRLGYKKKRIKTKCNYCEKEIEKYPSAIAKRNFCDVNCFHSYQKKFGFICEEENPSWHGGHSQYRGSNFRIQKEKAFIRDNYTCQKCGSKAKLTIHHIIPYHIYSSYDDANKLQNLISLCKKCHGKTEIEFNRNHKKYCNGKRIPYLILPPRICEKCNKLFTPYFSHSKWCNNCIKSTCLNCNQQFINKKHRINVKFCSKKCFYEYLNKKAKWKRYCQICNKKIKSGRNYCKPCFLSYIKPASKRRLIT